MKSRFALALILITTGFGTVARVWADTVVLKNGTVLRGTVDKDNTIVSVFDGIKRTIVKDTRIQSTEVKDSFPGLEGFQFVQPLSKHGGAMPTYAIQITSEPWNNKGRRLFSFQGPRAKRVEMTQAIQFLNPRFARFRGVDDFWLGQISLNQIPRSTIMDLLGVVKKENQPERLRVARFLIQAEMYPEAKSALDQLKVDFPELSETIDSVRKTVNDLEARQLLEELNFRRKGGQPRKVLNALKSFPADGVSEDVLSEVRDLLRTDGAQRASDKELADLIHMLSEELIPRVADEWSVAIREVLSGVTEAPEAIRERLEGLKKPEAKKIADKFALAMSGWVVGGDKAVTDLADAKKLWELRTQIHVLINDPNEAKRAVSLEWLKDHDPGIETVLRVIDRLAPFDSAPKQEISFVDYLPREPHVETCRVKDDDNPEPTEYMVRLPTDYSPFRQYPTVVALHRGRGPASALDFWGAEADKRGYIVIAPEYNTPGRPPDYTYSVSEHAAVELAIRDAKKRYSIDSDRVFLGGELIGGNMAWDFGLAHPDLFAGVVVVSGLPAKYVNKYLPNTERVPFYVVQGDLAPTANEVIFNVVLKPMISKGWDVMYSEYYRRGLEDFPEDSPLIFDWMDKRKREPYPKNFTAVSARDSDRRFFGFVIRAFAKDVMVDPSAVEPLGKNILKLAKIDAKLSTQANLLTITATGINKADIWISPKMIDFGKKAEIRVNSSKPLFKGMLKPDYGQMLEDLRVRGDKKQMYWLKLGVG